MAPSNTIRSISIQLYVPTLLITYSQVVYSGLYRYVSL